MSEELRENKMGTMPVRRLVLSMSLPMMIAMLVQALYNVVDSYFVAKLSENALTAVGMVFPFHDRRGRGHRRRCERLPLPQPGGEEL